MRETVLQLAREIESLSDSNVPAEEFFATFLDRLTRAVGARAAVVWLANGGPIRLAHQVGLEQTGFLSEPQAISRNEVLLREALQTGESRLYHPDGTELPTQHLYVVATLSIGAEPSGVLEVLLRAETSPEAKAGLLHFIEQLAGFASRYLTRQQDRGDTPEKRDPWMPQDAAPVPATPSPAGNAATPPSGDEASPPSELTPAFWMSLERFLLQLERSRSVEEVSSTAASDGRLLLGVDRVSVVRKRGRKTPVEAISGQEKVNPRSNLVRRMRALCKTVMAAREPLVYAGNIDDLPPQVEQPLADYVAESNSRLVIIVPLFESKMLVRPEYEEKELERHVATREPTVVGCLVVEQINDSRMPPLLREKIDITADHVAASLQQAITFERIFLRRTLLAIGRTGEWFHGRKLAKTLAILGTITAVGLGLWLIPYPYRVTAEGRLMPVTQRDVFAPWDGEVTLLTVRGGETVARGDLLAVLYNDELEAELIRLRTELDEKQSRASDLVGQINEAGRRGGSGAQERAQLLTERKALRAEIAGLETRIEIYESRQQRLQVTAPIDGVVATFQLDQLLRNRPVRRGEVLMEVMDDRGTWHLELDVEDARMGFLSRAIRREDSVALPVEFVLATDPEATHAGTLKTVESRAQTNTELGNVVHVEVALADQEAIPERRIGAEVRAKINTGPQPLGYVLFGDVIDFVRKHLWL